MYESRLSRLVKKYEEDQTRYESRLARLVHDLNKESCNLCLTRVYIFGFSHNPFNTSCYSLCDQLTLPTGHKH